MPTTTVDIVVVGAGPGGYTAALRASQRGADVALVERNALGGTCLNVGCIPSKALIHASNTVETIQHADEMGIDASCEVDFEAVVEWKDRIVAQLTGGVEQLCRSQGVHIYEGTATFEDPHQMAVTGDSDTVIEFDRAILATGSRPMELPGFDFSSEAVLDSSDVLSMQSLPDKLVVIGGGYIGMEVAQALAKLGTDVTVIEMEADILPAYPQSLTDPVKNRARQQGVEFELGHLAQGWEQSDDGILVETETEDGTRHTFSAERVLVAIGRVPVTESLALDSIDLDTNEDGTLDTTDQMQTDIEHVYAIGDIAGEPMLAHKASAEAIVAAEHATGQETTFSQTVVPMAVFTDPEIATVGYTQADAEAAGFVPVVGEFPFRASGRALTTGDTDGFVRIVADEDSQLLLGASIVGPHASELIAELTVLIEQGVGLTALEEAIHVHPTLSESVMEAAAQAMGRAIHTS